MALPIDSSLEVRLLIIHSAEKSEDAVRCTLIKSRLADVPGGGASLSPHYTSLKGYGPSQPDGPNIHNPQTNENDRDSPVPYNTISYTWGDPNDTTTIWAISFNVRPPSLAWLLRRIRCEPLHLEGLVRQPEGIPVWADAVFINQHNVKERSEQVSKAMGIIYKRTAKVL